MQQIKVPGEAPKEPEKVEVKPEQKPVHVDKDKPINWGGNVNGRWEQRGN